MEKYDSSEGYAERGINDYATHQMALTLKEQKFFIADKIYKKFAFKSALNEVIETSGLSGMPFLFACYEREFSKLSSETYAFEDDRYKAYSSLWGLLMEKYLSVKIPISDTIRENATAGHPGLSPEHFTLTDIQPLENLTGQLYKWDAEFKQYFSDIEKIESGRSDIDIETLDFENDFKLRFDIAVSISGDLQKEITKLLKPVQGDPIELLERNKKLRLLLTEIKKWPWTLQSFAWKELQKSKDSGKIKDSFARLILDFISETKYADDFDLMEFNRRVRAYYWAELFSLVKPGTVCDEEQNRVLKIIKLEMESLTDESNNK